MAFDAKPTLAKPESVFLRSVPQGQKILFGLEEWREEKWTHLQGYSGQLARLNQDEKGLSLGILGKGVASERVHPKNDYNLI